MPFVKLDCGILESSLWDWTPERHIFITALLMATPKIITTEMPQLEVDSLNETGFIVPPGKYGFVNASGSMIVKKALGLSHGDSIPDDKNKRSEEFEEAMAALNCLGTPDNDSRSQAFEGRRLVRVDGGYIVLNYNRFRDKDYTATERKRRERSRHVTPVTPVTSHHVTQAEAEAEADIKNNPLTPLKGGTSSSSFNVAHAPAPPQSTQQFYTKPKEPAPYYPPPPPHREPTDEELANVQRIAKEEVQKLKLKLRTS